MRRAPVAVAMATFATVVFAAPSAWAGTDIGYFYNSGDHDAKANFKSYGEHFTLCKLNNAKVYIDYQNAGQEKRVYYDGGLDTCTDINESFSEGSKVRVQVCEEKTLAPDDCSNFREGVA